MTLREHGTRRWAEVCPLCGATMVGRRSDARVCSAACRAEVSRLSRLLDGETVGPYSSVAARLKAARKRTSGPLSGTHESWTVATGEGGPEAEPPGPRSPMPASRADAASREKRPSGSSEEPAQGRPSASYDRAQTEMAGRCANSPRPA